MRRLFFLLLLAGAGFADSNLTAAIGWLKSAQDQNTGEINGYGVWGTAWGVVALAQYGENGSTLNKSLEYIAASQNNDGGIPYELGSPWGSGVDYSAPAILAFVSANKTPDSIKKNGKTPMDFIWGAQGANGGFGEWGEDAVSTSLAVIALSTSGENITKTGKDPSLFILSKQNTSDGGFEWWTKSEATAQALISLSAAGVNNSNTTAGLNYLKSLQNASTGQIVDPYITAFSAIAFNAYGWANEKELAIGYLKSVQNESGRTGRINASQASDAYTTALSALAFMNFSFKSADANVSCENTVVGEGDTKRCYVNSSISLPLSKFVLNNQTYYANGAEQSFENLPAGDYAVLASAFGAYGRALYHTPIKTTNFSVYGIVSPQKNQRYNMGDAVSIIATNLENATAYLNDGRLNGSVENRTYRYSFTANQTGNYTLTFNISGAISERNFSVSDAYAVQIKNPGGCTIGSAAQIAFSVLGANGNAVSNATVFACFNGACTQADSISYTCAGTNSFYVNASRNGNFGSAQIEFSGTTPNSGGGGGSYVTVEIEFPASSGRTFPGRVLNYGECEYAYDCFAKVANLDCGWFSAGGALACPGSTVSKTCLATGVDGIKAGSKGWWSFYTNGALSTWGISCYKVNNGDRIKLKYVGEYKADTTPAPENKGPTSLAAAPIATQKNTSSPPKETPAQKPALIETGGFRMAENIGNMLVAPARKSRATIVSGASAPCPTCDFASALLLKSGLDELNISADVTTDDKTRECSTKETIIFVGGPKANKGVSESYRSITGTADGAIYNITANCFVVAGNTRELTNRAVLTLIKTFK